MEYEVIITGDNPFTDAQYNGEDYIDTYDTDDEATLKETFIGALNGLGIKYARLPLPVQRQMLEDTFYDFKHNDTHFNITVCEL